MTASVRLIGRDTDCATVADRVRTSGLVTVVGPGGVGKTRLIASLFTDGTTDHESGREIRFGWLASLPSASGAEEIVRAAGFESAAAFRLVLSERALIVVLDNCEHVIAGVRELLMARPPGSATCVVATSRASLDVPGEQVVVLRPLGLPAAGGTDAGESPAVQLFLDRAASAGASLDATPRSLATIAELCRRLDGLPLAIELAAARTRGLSPAELVDLMDQRLDVLRRRTDRGDRHDSMRAAIDVSVAVLNADEQRWFRRLGVFVGPFDLTLAHAAAAEGHEDRLAALEMVTGLVDQSLLFADVDASGTRYRLLEVLRDHAMELLDASGERDSVEERFIDGMVHVADRVVADSMSRWDADVLLAAGSQFWNLRRACELCADRDTGPDRALRLMLPMFASVHQGRAGEVLAIGGRVCSRWPVERAPWRAEAFSVLASAAALARRHDDLVVYAAGVTGDPDATAIATAVVERALGLDSAGRDPVVAEHHFRRSRDAARVAGFSALEREVSALAAGQLALGGDGEQALVELDDLVAASQRTDDTVVETLAWLVRTGILLRSGPVSRAAGALSKAERAARRSTAVWWTAAIRRTRALVAAADHDGWHRSAPLWRAAVDYAVSQGAVGELAITLRTAAATADHLGQPQVALELLGATPNCGAMTVLTQSFPPDLEARLDRLGPVDAVVDPIESVRIARELLDRAAVDRGARATADANAGITVGPLSRVPAGEPANELVREGDVWRVRFRGNEVRIKHLKGIEDLSVLLARPDAEVHVLELMGASDTAGSTGPVIDDQARRAYQRRILELQEEIDEARAHHDPGRAERAETELDALVEQLSEAFGLGGRRRETGASAERARTAVTFRIRAAVRRLAVLDADLGRHLQTAVRTGAWCSYRPESTTNWRVESVPSEAR